jgi:hypothetical protein
MSREAPEDALSMIDAKTGDVYLLSNGHTFTVKSLTNIYDQYRGGMQMAVWGMEHIPEGSDSPAVIGRVGPGDQQRTLYADGCFRSFGNVMFHAVTKIRRRQRVE